MDTVKFDGRDCPVDYLGDGVYAIFDGFGIWLHANDHKFPTDRIYLEPEVLRALNCFVKNVEEIINGLA
jgi:hypothetical protein